MRLSALFLLLFAAVSVYSQPDMVTPFKSCNLHGSCTIYDYKQQKWLMSDPADAEIASLPASTFKIINLLIALETGVITDEKEVLKWPGTMDTLRYGYRPDTYQDLSIQEAFEISAVWVFLDLAKEIGRERYRSYLTRCHYGNADLSEADPDFWNRGALAISPRNQVEFLVNLHEGKLPFSARTIAIVKRVMVSEQTKNYTLRSKTGWTRENGIDSGWWVGYVERGEDLYFFATRVSKKRSEIHPNFGNCRKEITRNILHQLKALD